METRKEIEQLQHKIYKADKAQRNILYDLQNVYLPISSEFETELMEKFNEAKMLADFYRKKRDTLINHVSQLN